MLEAMYFGVPVITTHNGGSDMLIENEKSGIIIDDFIAEEWKDKTVLLLNDESMNSTIIKNAKDKIENEFTWDALVDKFIEVYEKRLNLKEESV